MKFSTCVHDKWIFKILIKGLRNLWKPSFSGGIHLSDLPGRDFGMLGWFFFFF